MLKIGEKYVYGSSGVVELMDICEMTSLGVTREYYVFKPRGASATSLTYLPTDSEKLLSEIRPLLTKKEVLSIIKEAKSKPDAEWIEDNRTRNERFKKIISSGDRTEIIGMINMIYKEGKRRGEDGKKNYLADENAMRKAERLVYSEFAEVLGISECEVPDFIMNLK